MKIRLLGSDGAEIQSWNAGPRNLITAWTAYLDEKREMRRIHGNMACWSRDLMVGDNPIFDHPSCDFYAGLTRDEWTGERRLTLAYAREFLAECGQ